MSREANSNPVLDATLASVVEKIIAKLESGEVPWHKPWTGRSTLPMNPVTGRTNQGIINPIILWLAEEDKGYGDNRWAGFSQWRKSGNPVRKGEKSTVIFMPILRRFKVEGDNGESVLAQRVVGWKFGRVFNNQQTTNPLPRPEVPQVDPSVGFEKAAALVKRVGAKLTHGGNRAFYAPAADRVQLPEPGQFDTLADYWSTNMHEHVHWTGAEERCNRKGIVKFSGFGSPSYAYEELVAEMGSAFLCQKLGIDRPNLMDNHAAYVGSWIKRLRKDPQVLLDAAGEAAAAVRHLMGE